MALSMNHTTKHGLAVENGYWRIAVIKTLPEFTSATNA